MPTTTVARAMATATSSETKGGRENAPDSILTSCRFELPPSARGVLVLADPPEAGWRMLALGRGGCGRTRPTCPSDLSGLPPNQGGRI